MFDLDPKVRAARELESARERYLTTTELIADAQKRLPSPVWDYIAGGTESETSLKRNRQAIDSLAFRPHAMPDVSTTDLTGRFLGQEVRLPIILAPVGGLQTMDPGAAIPVAEAAAEFGVMHMQSSVTDPDMEGDCRGGGPAMAFPALCLW